MSKLSWRTQKYECLCTLGLFFKTHSQCSTLAKPSMKLRLVRDNPGKFRDLAQNSGTVPEVLGQLATMPVQTYGKTLKCDNFNSDRGVNKKISSVKRLVMIHSACPCKNYASKCSQIPHKLDSLSDTLSRKKLSG